MRFRSLFDKWPLLGFSAENFRAGVILQPIAGALICVIVLDRGAVLGHSHDLYVKQFLSPVWVCSAARLHCCQSLLCLVLKKRFWWFFLVFFSYSQSSGVSLAAAQSAASPKGCRVTPNLSVCPQSSPCAPKPPLVNPNLNMWPQTYPCAPKPLCVSPNLIFWPQTSFSDPKHPYVTPNLCAPKPHCGSPKSLCAPKPPLVAPRPCWGSLGLGPELTWVGKTQKGKFLRLIIPSLCPSPGWGAHTGALPEPTLMSSKHHLSMVFTRFLFPWLIKGASLLWLFLKLSLFSSLCEALLWYTQTSQRCRIFLNNKIPALV